MKLLWPFRKNEKRPKRSALDWIAVVWKDTSDDLLKLNRWLTVAYAYVVCCRFQASYEDFVLRYGIGSPDTLASIRALLANYLHDGSESTPDCRKLRSALDAAHAADDDPLAEDSDAIDALTVHIAALDVVEVDPKHVLWLMDACFNLADREAFDIVTPDGGIVTQELEHRVRESEPMRREQEWQHFLIQALSVARHPSEVDLIAAEALRTLA